jgi:type I restriction-modification system DNA methylase subunit/predicted type IV restriction endonuclease
VGLPSRIGDLIQHFTQHIDSFKGGNYNETRARIEFIDPFFKELGWDIENTRGAAEAYKDVIHEDAVKVAGSLKAPDYSFRIGGQRKFFLEAKKPAINIKDDISPAYQLRRYAWSAGLPVSILTDFEEFAVYDTSIQPKPNDKASTARIFYCTFEEYEKHWDFISSTFSKEAIDKGRFDNFIKDPKKKKGTTAVDKEFLKEMEKWRADLAKNIALRNNVEIHALNYVVQATIDRILFLRICEAREIEEDGQLQKISEKSDIYKKLKDLFLKADEKYNSGLFHFHKEKENSGAPDEISLRLKIDDKILKEIIAALYYPSPYEFSVISADNLGNVYEQFLGKVIRLTAGGQAKVEEKPEVKKAGGVYYTPQYIVKYIVENTVGELLKNKTPMMVAGKLKGHTPLRILDPACGSGSFLIYAYQYLLEWHRDWYEKDIKQKGESQAKKWSGEVYQGPGKEWYLTTREKKRVLLNNIFGVDIDHQAVEVTKLNLLLKVLEGENRETLGSNLKLFQERALPDLSLNIKCGNSLIGSDFYTSQGKGQWDLFATDEEEKYKINAFDWDKEFPEVFAVGGFDAVIGNPPWGAAFSAAQKEYFKKVYSEIHVRTPESFNYFLYRIRSFCADKGLVGTIIPSAFLSQHEFSKMRQYLVQNETVARVANLGDGVFTKVSAPSCILIFKRHRNDHDYAASYADLRKKSRDSLAEELFNIESFQEISRIGVDSTDFILKAQSGSGIISKCLSWPTLKDIAEDVATGVSSGLDAAFVYDSKSIATLKLEKTILKKLVIGGEIERFRIQPKSGKQILYITRETNIKEIPNSIRALEKFKPKLDTRVETAQGIIPWYTLYRPRRTKLFEGKKILVRQTSDIIRAAFDDTKWYCLKSGIVIQLPVDSSVEYQYLVALLNSRLMNFIYNFFVGEQARVFPEVKPVQLFKLPIRIIDATNSHEVIIGQNLLRLVMEMTKLLAAAEISKSPNEKTRLQRQIDATDHEIDRLVYELYSLTEEEIKIVEGTNNA